MALTVMMIARDEAGVIGRAVDSVKGVAEEILVADTGSTDQTREVARAHGATVLDFAWKDDFSAARNFVLERARGEWVMGMDADEELLAGSVERLRTAMRDEGMFAYLVTLQNLADAARPGVWTEMSSLRLARRVEGVRFVGRIHEHPSVPLDQLARERGQRIGHSGVILRHTGFVHALKIAKLQRAVKLLKMELAERPGQLYYLIECGRTRIQLGDMGGVEDLIEASRQVWARRDAARAPIPSVALLLEFIILGGQNGIRGGPIGEEEAYWLAERWFPTSAPMLWMRANRHFAYGRFAEAAGCLEKLIEMGRTGAYDRMINFDPRILGADAVLNLGACYLRMGEVEKAEGCFLRVKDDASAGEAARKNLEVLGSVRGGA
ncbi:MAG: glycosyltransferase [Phycisphaerae bacterium]